jgi:hypothetical protein
MACITSPPTYFHHLTDADIFCIAQLGAKGLLHHAHAETDLPLAKAAISRVPAFLACLGPDAQALTRSWCL